MRLPRSDTAGSSEGRRLLEHQPRFNKFVQSPSNRLVSIRRFHRVLSITLQPHESSEDSELRRRTPPKVELSPRFPSQHLPVSTLGVAAMWISTRQATISPYSSPITSAAKQTRHTRFDSSGRRPCGHFSDRRHSPYVRQMTSAARRFTGQQVPMRPPTEAGK